MTPGEIEPATFRFLHSTLTAVPNYYMGFHTFPTHFLGKKDRRTYTVFIQGFHIS